MAGRGILRFLVGFGLGLLVPAATPALAGTPAPAIVPELQETSTFGMGARALGMGRAYLAIGEDVSAVAYNPAGLAQIRQIEFSAGLSHDDVTQELERSAVGKQDRVATRLEHLAFAYPYPAYRGSLVLAFAFHRMADLDQNVFMSGYVRPASGTGRTGERFGEVEVEDLLQKGTADAWTGGIAWEVSSRVSVGASLSYLSGSRREDAVRARGIPDPSAGECPGGELDEYGLYYGCGDPSERPLFRQTDHLDADLQGYTGSFGVLARFDSGVRAGAAVDLPRWLQYQGSYDTTLEDYFAVTERSGLFEDEITLPLSIGAGLSWARSGFLVGGDARWTDWRQIDFEGDLRGPDRDYAYRSVVALNVGAEYQISDFPLRVRAGLFTEPLPYDLVAADNVLEYDDGSDEVPGTDDDSSAALRYYPRADIVSDRVFWTLGAGALVDRSLTVDAAFQRGSWERSTPAGYDSPDGFATREKVTQNRLFVSATFHFE